jgi:gliding motility-associated lipoprotein GldH
MKRVTVILILSALIASCDDSRLYEKNIDFENRMWMINHKPEFEFVIDDTTQKYDVYCNVRNSLDFPFSRLFMRYYLQDSTGKVERQNMLERDLFDRNTGEPQGSSGLGDIYDHQFLLLKKYRFPYRGAYKIRFEQYMRKDTLDGILAVGVRIEKPEESN